MADEGKENFKTHTNKDFLVGLTRAFAGAIIFSFPLIMTMEMWSLGFTVDRYRLTLFMFLTIPLLVGLSYFIGFEETSCLTDDIVDAFVAYAVGFITSAVMLVLFNILDFTMSLDEIIGKISIQAGIAAIGAMLAQSQLGKNKNEEDENENDEKTDEEIEQNRRKDSNYFGEIFLMMVGALFLAMNPAPTEEIVLIGYKMSDWQLIFLAFFTMILMHAFVYKVEFRGQEKRRPENSSLVSVFFRYTVVGYAVVLLVGFYILWTFGQTDSLNLEDKLKITLVMAFPGALGAAASRLIL